MAALFNLAKMTTATTGTGTMTLGTAVAPYLTFALAGVTNGIVVTYAILDGSNSEIGCGTYTSSGTTLSRTSVFNSTNGGSKISLSGTAVVIITASNFDIQENYNVKSFGATGDGSTDDTAAIVAADAAAAAAGRTLFFPRGTYKVSSAITPSAGMRWSGENWLNTTLATSSATADLLTVSNSFFCVDNLNFATLTPRTAGNYINLSSSVFTIRDFNMTGAFQGIFISAAISTVWIDRGEIQTAHTSGIAIRLTGGVAVNINDVITTYDGISHPFAGVFINNGGDYSFTNCQFLAASVSVQLAPAAGQIVSYARFTHCWFDSPLGQGLFISPSSTGQVTGCDFVQCWFSSSASNWGVQIVGGGSTGIANLNFVACILFANAAGGFKVDGSTITNVGIANCMMSGPNGTGIDLLNSCSYVRITDNYISSFTNGILTDGTATNLVISGNQLNANTTTVSGTTPGAVIANLGIPTYATPGDVTAYGTIDTSQTGYSLAASSGFNLVGAASGLLIASDNNNGSTATFLTGGGGVALLGQSAGASWVASSSPTTSQVGLAYFSTSAVYRITNGTTTARTLYLQYFKTRPAV